MMRFITGIALLVMTAAAQTEMAGKYEGEWSSTNTGTSGKIRLAFSREQGAWKADVSFTLGDQDVKCTTTSLKVDGAKLVVSYTFDLQNNKLESTVTGELSGTTLAGTYRTRAVANDAPVDEGTFKAARTTARNGAAGRGPLVLQAVRAR